MAVLNNLRTNRYLKILVFTAVGFGMYSFVDPKFEFIEPITSTVKRIFKPEKARLDKLDLNSLGFAYGHQLYNNYNRPNFQGGTEYVEEPEDIALQAHMDYLSFIQSSTNTVDSKKRNLNTIWDHFTQRSFIKKEMESLEFNFSDAEKTDLVKGTITGINNAVPFFSSWWQPLRKDTAGSVDPMIDGKVLEDSIDVWVANSKVNANRQNYEFYNYVLRPFHISNIEIIRFMSLYDMGTFAPKLFMEQEYIDSKKTLNGKYIFMPFTKIKDLNIEVSEEEILEYYNSNKEDFSNNEKNRVIDYYIFETNPSVEDIKASKKKIIKKYYQNNKLESSRLDTTNSYERLLNFVKSESDNKNIVSFEKKSKLDFEKYRIRDTEFGDQFNTNNYFGPIVEKNMVKLGILVKEELDSVQVIFLNKELEPSQETSRENYLQAKDFRDCCNTIEEFQDQVKSLDNVKVRKDISTMILDDQIAGIETNGREIIKWVFGIPNNIQVPISKVEMLDVTEGSVSMFRTNIFDQVVVVVKKINEQDYKDLESVKSQITKVIREQKKSQLIKEEISSNWSNNIDELAKNLNLKISIATNLSFAAANFSSAGNDPGATGFFFGLNENEISEPYIGKRGVFVFLKTKVNIPQISDSEVSNYAKQIIGNVRSEFNLNILEQSKSSENIVDMRHMSF